MSNFLKYLESAWIIAAICAFAVMIYNLVTLGTFNHAIYFPFFCGIFSLLIWYNIRGQRRFRDKMFGPDNDKRQTK